MIDHETWLTAEEAYKYGFITDIEEAPDEIDELVKEVQNDLISMNGVNINIAAYAEPEKLRAKLTEIQHRKERGGTTMDFQAFLNSLPVDKRTVVENAMKEQLSNKTAELTTQVTNLTAQVTSLTDQLTTAQADLTTAKSDLTTAENRIKELETITSTEDADTKFLNSLPAEARQAVLDARQATAEAQAALAKANEEKAFASFQDKVKAYDNLPLQEDHVRALYNLSKACPTDFAAIEALFNSANSAMNKQFEQLGQDGDGEGAPTNAYEEIEKLIRDKRAADPTMDYNTAFAAVVNENPDLYDRYRNGQ